MSKCDTPNKDPHPFIWTKDVGEEGGKTKFKGNKPWAKMWPVFCYPNMTCVSLPEALPNQPIIIRAFQLFSKRPASQTQRFDQKRHVMQPRRAEAHFRNTARPASTVDWQLWWSWYWNLWPGRLVADAKDVTTLRLFFVGKHLQYQRVKSTQDHTRSTKYDNPTLPCGGLKGSQLPATRQWHNPCSEAASSQGGSNSYCNVFAVQPGFAKLHDISYPVLRQESVP